MIATTKRLRHLQAKSSTGGAQGAIVQLYKGTNLLEISIYHLDFTQRPAELNIAGPTTPTADVPFEVDSPQ